MSISRITAGVFRPLCEEIIQALGEIGISNLTIASARSPIIEAGGIFGGHRIIDDPINLFSLLVPSEVECQVLSRIISVGKLNLPGRGWACSEEIKLPQDSNSGIINSVNIEPVQTNEDPGDFTGIICIVQRGQGNNVGRVALDMGTCVPSVTFGTGLGIRDKMGLLRVTIPAEKEIIWAISTSQDAEIVFNGMIEAGQLDQPGKGFIYMFPLKQAHINMEVSRGILPNSAATPEQIIVAIDGILGGIKWRQRDSMGNIPNERTFLTGLLDFTLICNEGSSDDLVSAAMTAGAAGASIAKVNEVNPAESFRGGIVKPSAREVCYMIINNDTMWDIIEALETAACFTDEHNGVVVTSETIKAFTYLPSNK